MGYNLEEIIDFRPRRLPSADLAHLGQQLASALHHLHAAGYLHLDVLTRQRDGARGQGDVDRPEHRPPAGSRRQRLRHPRVHGARAGARRGGVRGHRRMGTRPARCTPRPPGSPRSRRWTRGTTSCRGPRCPRDGCASGSTRRWRRSSTVACSRPEPADRPTVLDLHRRLGDVLEAVADVHRATHEVAERGGTGVARAHSACRARGLDPTSDRNVRGLAPGPAPPRGGAKHPRPSGLAVTPAARPSPLVSRAPTEGDCTMLWTILIILAIVALALFIMGRVRGR